ncbi:MAG: nitrogenase component 1 [Lachnospiraceae bacterium]|nr:nitrogenase component 1 [Lachnospiraceae bacterium]
MKTTYRILPVYTGDVSGTCSALYEYGGMVVIHDPSGCNSTYNTHDESRWYDKESRIYISGLNEVDAVTGNDEKFINDIMFAAKEVKPKFIAMTNSPLPYLNGTDFKGIAKLLEKRLGIPVFYVKSNGSHDYSCGAGDAFLELAKKYLGNLCVEDDIENHAGDKKGACSAESFAKKQNSKRTKINILGLTPLDFDKPGVVDSLLKKLEDYEIISTWGIGGNLPDLEKSIVANFNLVVSVTGLKAAEWMKERFGIPFVCGVPICDTNETFSDCAVGAGTISVKSEIMDVVSDMSNDNSDLSEDGRKVYLVGEPVFMSSLAKYINSTFVRDNRIQSFKTIVVNPLETQVSFADIATVGEEDLEEVLSGADVVIGDPFYKYVTPENASFIEMSHLAFSGRCFLKERRNLFSDELEEFIREFKKVLE